jgi:hypothetical protein
MHVSHNTLKPADYISLPHLYKLSYPTFQYPSEPLMATCTFISRLESLAKKVESLTQSLQCATIRPSEDQYRSLGALSARLAKAAAIAPLEIEALKKRHAASFEEGRQLISQAQSDREGVTKSGQLRNRSVFARNIVLFFDGPKDSNIDSQTTKERKQLTRERCQRICTLSPDGLLSWAVSFVPTTWTANLMSKDLFSYVLDHIEPDDAQVWPLEIHNILDDLGTEEPLQGSYNYQEFLKGKRAPVRSLARKLMSHQFSKMEQMPQRLRNPRNESALRIEELNNYRRRRWLR